MITLRSRPHPFALLPVLAFLGGTAAAQGGTEPARPDAGSAQTSAGPRVNRESMWFAPGAEDWQRPCLITWQRSYADALAVSRETKKPILVCVNMDGEIASEHYAGVRYRQPEIAALYEPYVCVIASVYRHSPRDYDEQGRRILCPRFGSVTCGEHIAIEPGLFDKYFDGRRVAPRHIGVELDTQEVYDVYYAWDTDTIFNALRDGVEGRGIETETMLRGDLPMVERVASPDIQDRTAIENAYLQGDRAQRCALLESVLVRSDVDQVDLLRLAIFGFDLELAQLARRALAQCTTEGAIDLIAEALRVPLDADERDALIAALVRLGESFPRARTAAAVHQGLASRSSTMDATAWSKALEFPFPPEPPPERSIIETRLESQARRSKDRPTDGAAHLALAETSLALAADPETEKKFRRLLSEEAHRAAIDAEKLGVSGWRLNSILAVAASQLGLTEEAHARAETAVSGTPPDTWVASGPQGTNGLAVLALFAQSRQQAITKALREKREWPATWLTDVHTAYGLLARHPLGSDEHVVAHYDFLHWLGARGQATEILEAGLARFPQSWLLHDRLRARALAEKGADGLEAAYETLLQDKHPRPHLEWFAGLASLVAAEDHRRAGRAEPALAAYERGIAHYERGIEQDPETRATADHYIALALAGRARIAFEGRDEERALTDILASFARKPEAAASLDGLNLSPVDTAKMLLARLGELKRADLVATLQTALDQLDPKLLELPAYESEGPSGTSTDGRPPRRRGQPER